MSIGNSRPAPITEGRGAARPGTLRCPQNWGRLGLVLFCLVVRLAALDADPPPWLSWSTGLYTDEGFYTLDARHAALFGTLAPGDFHDRLLSPLLSLMQQGVFTVFGPGLLPARLLSVAFSLAALLVFWLGLRRAYDARTADLGALFLGLAPPFALYNRMALQETPTVFWLVLAFALWAQAGRWPRLLSGSAVAMAVVFKGLALIALPALAVPPAPDAGGAGREPHPAAGRHPLPGKEVGCGCAMVAEERGGVRFSPATGAAGVFALYFALWHWPHHQELARMAAFYRVHQMQPHSALSLWLNLRRGLVGGERGVLPYLLALMPVPCLLAGWGLGKRWTQADKYLTLWLAGGLLFCLLSSYAPSRYYVLFLPALAGLAARGLAGRKRPARLVAAGLFVLTSGAWFGAAWAGRTSTEHAAGNELTRLLPPGSVVIGEFAPALCLDTPFTAVPVQPGLSNDDQPVERLRATEIVVTRTPFWGQWWQARYPGIVRPSHRIATFTLGGSRHDVVDMYAVKAAGEETR